MINIRLSYQDYYSFSKSLVVAGSLHMTSLLCQDDHFQSIFRNDFDELILKKNLIIKKYYFNIFLIKKHFKKQQRYAIPSPCQDDFFQQ